MSGFGLTSDAVIYLPGIMGSELVDADGKVVWGMRPSLLARQVFFRDVMTRLKPKPDDDIRASQPVRFPVSLPLLSGIEPYTNLEHRLRAITVRPEAVIPFAYDWRHSIADAAAALAPVARAHLAQWRQRFASLPEDERQYRPEPWLTLVGHSMGGLVASWFTTVLRDQGGDQVRLVVTLGTPFAGAVKALRVLATGAYLPLGLFADSLRDAARTMPGLYELLATYDCVDEGDGHDGWALPFRRLTPDDVVRVGGDLDLTTAAQSTMATLGAAITRDHGWRFHSLVGTSQPTLQSVRFGNDGTPSFAESLADESHRRADHRGDGTVYRFAARPEAGEPALRARPAYLPQSHGALAKTPEGVEFAVMSATETVSGAGPFQAGADIGVRVPELAVAGVPFTVEAVDAPADALCQVHDTETNALVAIQAFADRDGAFVTDVLPPGPGLYRVSVAATGLSPVEHLVLVAEPA